MDEPCADEDVEPAKLRRCAINGLVAELGRGEIAGKAQTATSFSLDRLTRLLTIRFLSRSEGVNTKWFGTID
jgi:hypothetical protein